VYFAHLFIVAVDGLEFRETLWSLDILFLNLEDIEANRLGKWTSVYEDVLMDADIHHVSVKTYRH
jgi:hypothetical protein